MVSRNVSEDFWLLIQSKSPKTNELQKKKSKSPEIIFWFKSAVVVVKWCRLFDARVVKPEIAHFVNHYTVRWQGTMGVTFGVKKLQYFDDRLHGINEFLLIEGAFLATSTDVLYLTRQSHELCLVQIAGFDTERQD